MLLHVTRESVTKFKNIYSVSIFSNNKINIRRGWAVGADAGQMENDSSGRMGQMRADEESATVDAWAVKSADLLEDSDREELTRIVHDQKTGKSMKNTDSSALASTDSGFASAHVGSEVSHASSDNDY